MTQLEKTLALGALALVLLFTCVRLDPAPADHGAARAGEEYGRAMAQRYKRD